MQRIQQQQALLDAVAAELKAQPAEAAARVTQMLDHAKALEKELARLKSKLAAAQGDDLVSQAVEVKGVKVIAATLEGADATALRETLDKLKDKLKSAAIVLASTGEGKVSLIAGVTADLTGKVKAGELVNFVAQQVGGKGGGRPDMAQAGGTESGGPAGGAGFGQGLGGSETSIVGAGGTAAAPGRLALSELKRIPFRNLPRSPCRCCWPRPAPVPGRC
jgi:alanyl-tRNA synthetase